MIALSAVVSSDFDLGIMYGLWISVQYEFDIDLTLDRMLSLPNVFSQLNLW